MSRTFTLTSDQRALFAQTGLLRLPGFFAPDIFKPMADAVWADLAARFGMRSDDPVTWTVTRPFQLGPLVVRSRRSARLSSAIWPTRFWEPAAGSGRLVGAGVCS
jgi:hypothetical protein